MKFWDVIKKALIGLMGSKKVQTAVIGLLAAAAVRYLPMDAELANQTAMGILTIFTILLGAQGLTDWGKGDVGQALTLGDCFKKLVNGLFGSKKFITAIVGVIALVLVKYLKIGGEFANQVASGIVTIIGMLIGAQGVTDLGKEAPAPQTVTLVVADPVEVAPVTQPAAQAS